MCYELSLVVGCTSAVNIAILNHRFKWGSFPFIEWINRLHVVMVIYEKRWISGILNSFSINNRGHIFASFCPFALDCFETGLFQLSFQKFHCVKDITFMFFLS